MATRNVVQWTVALGAAFIISSPIGWAKLSSANVSALAVYVADTNTSDSLSDAVVNYNITSPALIDAILGGIEFDVLRNCGRIDSKDSTYLYVKLKDGSRRVFSLFLLNTHVSLKSLRVGCHIVSDSARVLIEANAQTQP